MTNREEMLKIVEEAAVIASQNNNEVCTKEHLLLRLLQNEKIMELFNDLNADIVMVELELTRYINERVPKAMRTLSSGHINPKVSQDFYQTLEFAQQNALGSKRPEATVYDLLIGFYYYNESFVRSTLEKSGLTIPDLRQYFYEKFNYQAEPVQRSEGSETGQGKLNYLINLNEKVLNKKIDPVFGRDQEIDRVIHILVRKKKNNPILTGEPGVGKTAIAEGLAKKIVEKTVHKNLLDYTIYSLDMGSMTAGTKFRGEFEARLKKVIDKLSKEPKSILFIDEIHTLVGAGGSGNGGLDAANILKPALSSGDIKCIGATTYKEYRNIFEKDAALSRRFQKVDIVEPSIKDTKLIMQGVKKYYEDFHGVTYTDKALEASVDLSAKYITDRFLPDKAIDLIDEAGAYCKLENPALKEVTESMIEKIVAKIAKIPEKQIVESEKEKVKGLEEKLESVIFGQDKAIKTLVDSILLSKSGLRDTNKPIGSFLFCGPTGVGKTELTKQLAKNLGINFIRLDMSEYMEKHNVSKLIGAPPGYVGYEQEGLLSGQITKSPHSVILLDELEKAHPDVWNILLQIMDNGFLTDNYGKKIDFRQSILVMTSNIGSDEISTKRVGLIDENKIEKPTMSIERAFSPEFRNRLDAIIWFNSLDEKNIRNVLEKNLIELKNMLEEKKISISYSDLVKDWLVKNGYNPSMGARPMNRLIQEKIKTPLSKEILFGKLENGGEVFVDLINNELIFSYKKSNKRKKVLVKEIIQ